MPDIDSGGAFPAGRQGRRTDDRRLLAWGAILAVALALRLGFLAAISGSPFGASLVLDSQLYSQMADRILAGQPATPGAYFVDPAYAYFLALLYLVGGHSLLLVRLVQIALGTASCLLAAWLGEQLAGRRIGLLAGLATAAYPLLVYYDLQVLKTTLEIFLCLAGTALLVRARREDAFLPHLGAGALLGLGVLTHAALGLMIPMLAAWEWAAAPAGRRRRAAFGTGALIGGAALCILPIAARNALASGELVPTTYNAGMNYWEGNNPEADGAYHRPAFLDGDPLHEEAESHAEAERRTGRALGPAETSAFWFREAARWQRDHPRAAARLLARKAALFWNHHEVDDNISFYFARQFVPFLALPLPGFRIWGSLGLAGLLWSLPRWRRWGPAQAPVLALGLGAVAFHVVDRYRLPAVPFLALLGSALLADVWNAALARRLPRAAGLAALAAAAALAVNLPTFYRPQETFSRPYYSLGKYYFEHGDDANAIAFCQRSLAVDDRYLPPQLVLAKALLRAGRPGEALPHFRAVVALDPGELEGSYGEGISLLRLGRPGEAELAFRRALADDPEGPALYWMGEARLAAADPGGAADWFRRALAHGDRPQARLGLARALLAAGDLAGARDALAALPPELRDPELERRAASGGP